MAAHVVQMKQVAAALGLKGKGISNTAYLIKQILKIQSKQHKQ